MEFNENFSNCSNYDELKQFVFKNITFYETFSNDISFTKHSDYYKKTIKELIREYKLKQILNE